MRTELLRQLVRWRYPRTRITYAGNTAQDSELQVPFGITVLASLSGNRRERVPLQERCPILVDCTNIDAAIAQISPELKFNVENTLSEDEDAPRLGVSLRFQSRRDFTPDGIAEQVRPLKSLLEERKRLVELRADLKAGRRSPHDLERL